MLINYQLFSYFNKCFLNFLTAFALIDILFLISCEISPNVSLYLLGINIGSHPNPFPLGFFAMVPFILPLK